MEERKKGVLEAGDAGREMADTLAAEGGRGVIEGWAVAFSLEVILEGENAAVEEGADVREEGVR